MAVLGTVRALTDVTPRRAVRKSYARIPMVLPIPDLIQTQVESFNWFRDEGLRELFDEISPIVSFNKNLELHFPGLQREAERRVRPGLSL